MTIEAVQPPGPVRVPDDIELMLAASCLPLPEAMIGLVAAQQARMQGDAAQWTALDSVAVAAVGVLSGAVALAALVSALTP